MTAADLIEMYRLFVIPLEDGNWMVGLNAKHDREKVYLDKDNGIVDGIVQHTMSGNHLITLVKDWVNKYGIPQQRPSGS